MWARKEECTEGNVCIFKAAHGTHLPSLQLKVSILSSPLSVYLCCPPSLSIPTIPAPLRKDEEQEDFEEPEPGAERPVLPLQESPRVESGSGMRQVSWMEQGLFVEYEWSVCLAWELLHAFKRVLPGVSAPSNSSLLPLRSCVMGI